jgi:MoxR-like ATPase
MLSETTRKKLLEKDPLPDILGQGQAKSAVASALLAKRHIIIIGPPGIGKTTLAKNVASLLGKDAPFVRVQGSPDLTVEDLLGDIDPIKALKFGPSSTEAFTKGKIFKADKGVLFFDELNRCPEKLQNALLQVLEEGKATIGSYDVDFNLHFIFIATMNPEDSSTEKLSDVLLDRFDIVYMEYPESIELEKRIIELKGEKLCAVPEKLLTMMVYFVRMLRSSDKLEKKPSVRATLGLYERSQAHAVLQKRKQVEFDDIKAVLLSVLAHRIRLKPSSRYLISPTDFVKQEFERHVQASQWGEESPEKEGEGP